LYYQFHQKPQVRAIKETVRKFEEIKLWFEKQTTYHFFSSSIIVIYEANLEEILNEKEEDETNADNNNNNKDATGLSGHVKIAMADFAHVFPAKGQLDHNYLFGLEKLIEHHKMLLEPGYKFKDVRVK
jgi:hypothetical protein